MNKTYKGLLAVALTAATLNVCAMQKKVEFNEGTSAWASPDEAIAQMVQAAIRCPELSKFIKGVTSGKRADFIWDSNTNSVCNPSLNKRGGSLLVKYFAQEPEDKESFKQVFVGIQEKKDNVKSINQADIYTAIYDHFKGDIQDEENEDAKKEKRAAKQLSDKEIADVLQKEAPKCFNLLKSKLPKGFFDSKKVVTTGGDDDDSDYNSDGDDDDSDYNSEDEGEEGSKKE